MINRSESSCFVAVDGINPRPLWFFRARHSAIASSGLICCRVVSILLAFPGFKEILAFRAACKKGFLSYLDHLKTYVVSRSCMCGNAWQCFGVSSEGALPFTLLLVNVVFS